MWIMQVERVKADLCEPCHNPELGTAEALVHNANKTHTNILETKVDAGLCISCHSCHSPQALLSREVPFSKLGVG